MKVAAVIAEYNPFHNGHEWHLAKTRKLSGADYVIVLMSPCFVQRGEAAIADQHLRAKAALLGGADLVLELPVCFATGSAWYFAQGGVALLSGLGCVDTLSFGVEACDGQLLQWAASILAREPSDYREILQKALREGHTFPAARAQALEAMLTVSPSHAGKPGFPSGIHDRSRILDEQLLLPNNILGLEYLQALSQSGSGIRPCMIPRRGAGFHDENLPDAPKDEAMGSFAQDDRAAVPIASATALRRAMTKASGKNSPQATDDSADDWMPFIPASSAALMEEHIKTGSLPDPSLYDGLLRYSLLQETRQAGAASLQRYLDVSRELSARILQLLPSCLDTVTFSHDLKTKNLTYARVNRALLHILLGIGQEETDQYLLRLRNGEEGYLRLLGFRREAAPLLHQIRNSSAFPLISKTADAAHLLTGLSLCQFRQDIHACDIYRILVRQKGSEYTRSPVILESDAD